MNESEDIFDTDVIVVGGGPVGAVLALALTQGVQKTMRVTVL